MAVPGLAPLTPLRLAAMEAELVNGLITAKPSHLNVTLSVVPILYVHQALGLATLAQPLELGV